MVEATVSPREDEPLPTAGESEAVEQLKIIFCIKAFSACRTAIQYKENQSCVDSESIWLISDHYSVPAAPDLASSASTWKKHQRYAPDPRGVPAPVATMDRHILLRVPQESLLLIVTCKVSGRIAL